MQEYNLKNIVGQVEYISAIETGLMLEISIIEILHCKQ